jgi:hypothetical protein
MKGNMTAPHVTPNGRFWNLVHGHESAAVDPCRHGRGRLTDLGCAHVFGGEHDEVEWDGRSKTTTGRLRASPINWERHGTVTSQAAPI